MCLGLRSSHAAATTDRRPRRGCPGIPLVAGRDLASRDPRARVEGALAVLAPAALVAAAIVALAPAATWLIFAFGWVFFPAVGQLVGGVAALARPAAARAAAALDDERTRREAAAAARVAASLAGALAARFLLLRVIEPAAAALAPHARRAGYPVAVAGPAPMAPNRFPEAEPSRSGGQVTYL